MNTPKPHMYLIAIAVLSIVPAALAQNGAGAVIQTLDAPVELQIDDQPILEALERISRQSDLSIELTERTLRWLPHGEQTRVSLRARNVSLRDALTAMLQPMNLTWQVSAEGVRVEAVDALKRMGRRPSFAETRALAQVLNTVIEPDTPALTQLRVATGLPRLDLLWHVPEDARAEAIARADSRRPCTGQEYLNMICHGRGWTWYLWGNDIAIMPKQMLTERQLRQTVTVAYRGESLIHVLRDLLDQAELDLQIEPGALALLPPETRESFTLLMADATVGEALEAISGATGLVFTPGQMSVTLSAGGTLQALSQPAQRERQPFILLIRRDVAGMEMMIPVRVDDLPEDLAEQLTDRAESEREAAIAELIEQFSPSPPSTQPAVSATTQPAE